VSHPLGYNPDLLFRDHPAPGHLLKRLFGPKGNYPAFFIAGAQKSGTTSLYAALRGHPGFAKPRLKEPFYYGHDYRYSKGSRYYRTNFAVLKQGQFSVDGSTNYLDHPLAPGRIRQDVPHAKAIILLRNPVTRAFSHYRMQVKNKIELLPFAEAIAREDERIAEGIKRGGHNYFYQRLGYRSRGEYSRMIDPWLEGFGDDLLVLIAEDFFADPLRVYAQVLDFLGLEKHIPESIPIRNAGEAHTTDERVMEQLKEHYRPFNAKLAAQLKTDLGQWA
jgi:hypothetical protein